MHKRNERLQELQKQKRKLVSAMLVGFGLIFASLVGLFYFLQHSPGGQVAQQLSTIPVEVNFAAPELSLENIQGKFESLADFRDKVVLLNNWATWCPPCKAEMPTLVEFYKEHAGDGLMIIAVEAGESADQVKRFAEAYKIPFVVWIDPETKSLDAFKNGNLPNSYVIDRSGIVRLAWTGEINRETLEKYVTPLLSGN